MKQKKQKNKALRISACMQAGVERVLVLSLFFLLF
jgi:hypothetical protein